jgi:2-isopropylmalate synthase
MQLDLPKKMQPAFYQVVQSLSERTAKEITSDDIEKAFRATYYLGEGTPRFELVDYEFATKEGGKKVFRGAIRDEGKEVKIEGEGNGPVSALLQALNRAWPEGKHNLEVKEYSEHALGHGSDGSSSFSLSDFRLPPSFALFIPFVSVVLMLPPSALAVKAASYVALLDTVSGRLTWGVGVSEDVTEASLKAVLSASSNAAVAADRRLLEIEDFVVGGRV